MYQLNVEAPNLVFVRAEGELSAEDYRSLIPRIEALISEHGRLRFLMDVTAFSGAKPGAILRDLKFDAAHRNDFERVAMIGDASWEAALTKLGAPLTSAEVKYFPAERLEDAEAWLRG